LSPGRFLRAGPGRLDWAPLDAHRFPPGSVPTWIDALAQTGTSIQSWDDFQFIEWRKIAWNASMNPVLALAGKKNGALFEDATLMTRFELLLSEVIAVAKASGSDIDPAGTLQAEILTSVRATAENLNSMAVDVLNRRPTEIEWINAAVLRRAQVLGIATPENQKIVTQIRS
jgi:2-dehydropantoate 2-reductase